MSLLRLFAVFVFVFCFFCLCLKSSRGTKWIHFNCLWSGRRTSHAGDVTPAHCTTLPPVSGWHISSITNNFCNVICRPLCCWRHSLTVKRGATLSIMPSHTTENVHFGLMRAGFAEAAVTQGRSVVSATDPGRVMTVVDDNTRPTGFPPGSSLFVFIQLFFFFSPVLLLPPAASALLVGRQVNWWTC